MYEGGKRDVREQSYKNRKEIIVIKSERNKLRLKKKNMNKVCS